MSQRSQAVFLPIPGEGGGLPRQGPAKPSKCSCEPPVSWVRFLPRLAPRQRGYVAPPKAPWIQVFLARAAPRTIELQTLVDGSRLPARLVLVAASSGGDER